MTLLSVLNNIYAPGSSTRTTLATLNITWSMAVPWKKGAAPMVVPGIRVVICISPWLLREAIYRGRISIHTCYYNGQVYSGEARRRRCIRTDDQRVLLSMERICGAFECRSIDLDGLPYG